MTADVETIAWAGETPWHGLGKKVLADLTPEQMAKEAQVDWGVEKLQLTFDRNGVEHNVPGQFALVRDMDEKVLSIVSEEWNVLQNNEAFEFFHDFVMNGEMEMHTAGSLAGGKLVWVLAKTKHAFEPVDGDQVDQYMLFTNPHQFGRAIDVRTTGIRVVCMNTLMMALKNTADNFVKVHHRKIFDADEVKQVMGIATAEFDKYGEAAKFLASKPYNADDLISYYNEVFPSLSKKDEEKMSRGAKAALEVHNTQPGHGFGQGTWWQPLNTVTFLTNHQLGREVETRLESVWFGNNAKRNQFALKKALEYAK